MSDTIATEGLDKAIDALDARLAGEPVDKAQIQQGRSTNRGNLKPEEVDDEPADDEPTTGGTNYKPKGKVEKGMKLPPPADDKADDDDMDYDKDDKDDEDEDDASNKSYVVSGWLKSFVTASDRHCRVITDRLDELRQSHLAIEKGYVTAIDTVAGEVRKSFAQADAKVKEVEGRPARGPVSALREGDLEKSQGQGNTHESTGRVYVGREKNEMAGRIRDLVFKGVVNASALLRFEGTGVLDKATERTLGQAA